MLCNTHSTACWTLLSSSEAIPNGRLRPSGLGIQTGVTGAPLCGQLPGKLLEDLALGIEAFGFLSDPVGLQR